MSLQQLKNDVNKLKESTKARHLQVLLTCEGEDLTDFELTKLLMNVPIRQLSTSVLRTIIKRGEENNRKCLEDLPEGYFEKMNSEFLDSLTEEERADLNEYKRKKREIVKGV